MFDVFHKLPVSHDLDDGKTRSRDVIVDTQVKFCTLLLEPEIHDGLAKCGYICLSPIQQNALPLALTGSSIIAHAKSGTGKTLIYVIPILNDFVKRKLNGLHCLVLAPTREIAKQIYDVFRNVACHVKGLQIEYFIGGTPLDMDVIKCMNCHVAIGAPGRIKHLVELGYLKTTNLEFLVLDEVDALFDHKEYAVEEIINALPSPKQLIVCTATFSSKVGDVVKSVVPNVKYTSADSSEIEEISNISNMLIAIKQYVAPVTKDSSMGAMRKREKLVEILKHFNFEQCFIFVNYMTLVRSIYNHLISQNFSALWICSDQNQSTRINTINKLKMNHCKILVTTDLAARGIDVHKVNLVVNLGLPCPPEIYIHRMGRAGRYGSEGAVITILSEGEEMTTFTKMIGVISTDPIDLHVLPEQMDADMANLDIIRCLPTEGSISVDEFCFKRQMKSNQENAAKMQNGKKTKKKKRKDPNLSKFASHNISDQLPSVRNNVDLANGEENTVADEMTDCIEQFSQSLADFLIAGDLTPDWDDLKGVFGLEDGSSDESFAFHPNPSAALLTYARHIRQRNEVIDEQTAPCDVDQFCSLLNRSGVFDRHSAGLRSLIAEICAKICRPKLNGSASSCVGSSDSQSEISSQLSGVASLSERFHTISEEKNFSEWSCQKKVKTKNVSGRFGLAEEFSNAMMNYGRANGSCYEEQKISHPLSISNRCLEDEKQIRQHTNRIQADCTPSLSDEFSRAVNSGDSSKMPPTSPTDSSHSISTADPLLHAKTNVKAKRLFADFNLSDQFLNAVSSSVAEADFQQSPRGPKTSPLSPRPSDQLSNEKPGNEIREQVPTNYSSSNSLSDQFSISVNGYNRESTIDHGCRTEFDGLENSQNKSNANSSAHRLLHETNANSETIPAVADQKIPAVPRNPENMSKSTAKDPILSDQCLDAFESKEKPEISSCILNFSDQHSATNVPSGTIIPASIPNIERVSSRSFNFVPEVKSQLNCVSIPNMKPTSHLSPEVEFEPESCFKSMLIPESETTSNTCSVHKMNKTCSSTSTAKNVNRSSFAENDASNESRLIPNSKQKLNFNVTVASDLKSYRNELAKTSAADEAENRLVETCSSSDDTFGDVIIFTRKPSHKNVNQCENAELGNTAVPISIKCVATASTLDTDFKNDRHKTDHPKLPRDNQIATTLPTLRSHVGGRQEQRIWQHHFAFIKRQALSRGGVMSNQ